MRTVLIKQKSHPSILRRNPVERIEETISQHNPDLIVAPEYFMNNERRIYTREEKDTLVQRIADVSGDRLIIPGTILWQENGEMRNTLFAVSDGKALAEHDKSVDGGDKLIAQCYGINEVHYGEWKACAFPWKGFDVSLEICMEHGDKLLKETGEHADLQIVAGHGAVIRPHALHLKTQGYAIVCDGQRPRTSEIQQRTCFFPQRYRPVEREDKENTFIYNLFPEGR